MNKQICLATNNKGKLEEYRKILAPMGFVIYSPSDLNVDLDVEETGTTYRENSYLKAKAFCEIVPFPVLSDDSGLEIHAMNGAPGLYSARFAEERGGYPNAYKDIFTQLDGRDRSAHFHCCICYLENASAKPLYFEGDCPGRILESPHGDHGFGYDPIFHCDEADVDFGVADPETKNAYSHRAKAIQKLKIFLAIA
ncbi:MAG: RdgB/HAM1 family non-canonical purine NTP pyrophosphatase [Bacilli bacterium]|nr:RdgB/HAM1 family non-canonical purine NTP pyrophosphatase [Bacilli bacterium]